MEKLMKKFFRTSIITSIILIALGILLIFQSEATIMAISYLIGGILVALGVMAGIKFFRNTNNENKGDLDLVYGIVSVILGIIVIKNPEAIASIMPIILGISIIISSATKLQYSFESVMHMVFFSLVMRNRKANHKTEIHVSLGKSLIYLGF